MFLFLFSQVTLRRRKEDTPEHNEKILEEDVEESQAKQMQARLDRANQLREAAERKVASLARRLAQVQAEASVAAVEAERAEVWYNQRGGGGSEPGTGEEGDILYVCRRRFFVGGGRGWGGGGDRPPCDLYPRFGYCMTNQSIVRLSPIK